jgi:murein DD-endopeptidase MepM/ murein hydrolase activator NlpD
VGGGETYEAYHPAPGEKRYRGEPVLGADEAPSGDAQKAVRAGFQKAQDSEQHIRHGQGTEAQATSDAVRAATENPAEARRSAQQQQVSGGSLSPEKMAVLDAIAHGEVNRPYVRDANGNLVRGGYDETVSGQHFNPEDYPTSHPYESGNFRYFHGRHGQSSASGRYQETLTTYRENVAKYGIPGFTKEAQEQRAWLKAQELYARQRNNYPGTTGDLEADVKKFGHDPQFWSRAVAPAVKHEWTSVPGGLEHVQRTNSWIPNAVESLERNQGQGKPSAAARDPNAAAGPGNEPRARTQFNPETSQFDSDVFPVTGHVTSAMGNRANAMGGRGQEFHPGTDIGAPAGSEVRTPHGGTVVRVGPFGGYGNSVDIQRDDGTIERYGHLLEVPKLKVGQQLGRGEVFGKVGSTGRSTGPHLHFELRDPKGRVLNSTEELGVRRGQQIEGGSPIHPQDEQPYTGQSVLTHPSERAVSSPQQEEPLYRGQSVLTDPRASTERSPAAARPSAPPREAAVDKPAAPKEAPAPEPKPEAPKPEPKQEAKKDGQK